MQVVYETLKAHVVKWEMEYICLGCYVAGYYNLLGKFFKMMARFVG